VEASPGFAILLQGGDNCALLGLEKQGAFSFCLVQKIGQITFACSIPRADNCCASMYGKNVAGNTHTLALAQAYQERS
jgi:hypothetical protein